MEIQTIVDYAFSTGNLWAVLFVVLLFKTTKDRDEQLRLARENAKEREEKLMEFTEKTNQQHLEISRSMENLERGITSLSNQLKDLSDETRLNLNRVWEKISEIK